MKKIIMIVLFITSMSMEAQMYLSDPYIVNQAKREVFHSWANFTPSRKKILGVYVYSHHFEMAWAGLAPKQNSRYRRGKDIRPLSEKGDLTLVELSTIADSKIADSYSDTAEKLGQSGLDEVLYYSTGNGNIPEPFWNLYYKNRLTIPYYHGGQITEFVWAEIMHHGTDESDIQKWSAILEDEILSEQIEKDTKIFKERITNALKIDMERGERIINLHKIYEEWLIYERQLANEVEFLSALKNVTKEKEKIIKDNSKSFKAQNERELMKEIILDAKLNYRFKR